MKSFITVVELNSILKGTETIILDCRADLKDSSFGIKSYNESHIPGAQFVNAESVLTGKIQEHGGRHPMPKASVFIEHLEKLGVSTDSNVVVYGVFAARLSFMLQLLNIKNVSILEGGFNYWKASDFPSTTQVKDPERGKILSSSFNYSITVDIDFMKKNYNNPSLFLIDCRAPERYKGENEPMDPVAGHIPGASNFFWGDNFKSDETLLAKQDLIEKYKDAIATDKEIVLYCGSGVTACWNFSVLSEIGINSKIYLGSWSDWISYPENSVATKL